LGFGRLNFDDADVVGELPDRAAAADPRKARRSYADQVLEMFRSRGLKGYKAITLAKVAYLGEPCCPISGRRGRSDLSRSGVTSKFSEMSCDCTYSPANAVSVPLASNTYTNWLTCAC